MATLALATSAAAQSSLERGDYLVNLSWHVTAAIPHEVPPASSWRSASRAAPKLGTIRRTPLRAQTSHQIPILALEGGAKATSRYRLRKDCALTVCRSRPRSRLLFTRL